MEEPERIENRMARLPEALEHRCQRRLRSLRAFGMAAHAVDHREQRCILGNCDRHSVLIVVAMAEQRDICILDLQDSTACFR